MPKRSIMLVAKIFESECARKLPDSSNHNQRVAIIEEDPSSTLQQAEVLFQRYVNSRGSALSSLTTSASRSNEEDSTGDSEEHLRSPMHVDHCSLQNIEVSALPLRKENEPITEDVLPCEAPEWESVQPLFASILENIAAEVAIKGALTAKSIPLVQKDVSLLQAFQDSAVQTDPEQYMSNDPQRLFSVISNMWLQTLIARLEHISAKCHPNAESKSSQKLYNENNTKLCPKLAEHEPFSKPTNFVAIGCDCALDRLCNVNTRKPPGNSGDRLDKKIRLDIPKCHSAVCIPVSQNRREDPTKLERSSGNNTHFGDQVKTRTLPGQPARFNSKYHHDCIPPIARKKNDSTLIHKSERNMYSPQLPMKDNLRRMFQQASSTNMHRVHSAYKVKRSSPPWR